MSVEPPFAKFQDQAPEIPVSQTHWKLEEQKPKVNYTNKYQHVFPKCFHKNLVSTTNSSWKSLGDSPSQNGDLSSKNG